MNTPPASTNPVEQSLGVFVHHFEKYHLEQPTWEVTSLISDPKGNYEVHHEMLDGMIDPLVGALP